MKCEAIFANSSGYSVRKMCQAMGLKESSYYQWKHGQKRRDERIAAEKEEMMQVQQVFEETNRTYGCRRIKQALRSIGKEMSEWKIRRIMRENGFYPVQIRKYRPGEHLKPDGRYFENKVRQEFNAQYPNEKWVGDITYLKTKLGWVNLAAVIDLYNREVIGYAVSKKMDADLACQALSNAIASRGRPTNQIFHSDRGCQYSSKKYQLMLEEYGITGSMSKPGYPYDNSCMESFFASMKK